MSEKPHISLSLMPTYTCSRGCEYCYLTDKAKQARVTDAFIRHLNKRLKELSAKYVIDIVEVYGGDLDEYNKDWLSYIVQTYRMYCDNDRIMLTDIKRANKLGFPDNHINISINPERSDYIVHRSLLVGN